MADKFEGLFDTFDETAKLEIVSRTEVIVRYDDGSAGVWVWRDNRWRPIDGYSTDAATATGMYD